MLRRFLAVLLPCVLAVAAHATTLDPVETTCPVCARDFVAYEVGSYNTFGGVDADGCMHARGDQPMAFWVWTCPGCLYTEWGGDFETEVADDLKARLAEGLRALEPVEPDTDQRDIPGAVKYDLLRQTLEIRGGEETHIAVALLRGAWVVRATAGDSLIAMWDGDDPLPFWEVARDEMLARSEAVRAEPDTDENAAVWEVLVGRQMLAAEPPADESAAVGGARLLMGAYLLRVHGENLEAEPVLRLLFSDEEVPAEVRTTAQKLLDGVARERMFQESYLARATALIQGDGFPPDEAPVVVRVVAETLRRLGRTDEAALWFRRALELPELSIWDFRVVRDALRRMGSVQQPTEEEYEALWGKKVDALVADLRVEGRSYDAYESLRSLADRRTIPGIVEALADEDPAICERAAKCLRVFENPGPAAVAALVRALEERTGDAQEEIAKTLLDLGDPASRDAFARTMKSRTWRAVHVAVDALGIVGESADVDLLLRYLATHSVMEEEVLRSLGYLANRKFDDRESFDRWREVHGTEPRRQWVRAGFTAAGITLPETLDTTAVPVLLDALESPLPHVRANAARLLIRISGRCLGWKDLASDSESKRGKERRDRTRTRWRTWWENR